MAFVRRNVGLADRIVRIIIGLALITTGLITGWWWLYIISIIPFVTAFFSFCPLYSLIGVGTCGKSSEKCG